MHVLKKHDPVTPSLLYTLNIRELSVRVGAAFNEVKDVTVFFFFKKKSNVPTCFYIPNKMTDQSVAQLFVSCFSEETKVHL